MTNASVTNLVDFNGQQDRNRTKHAGCVYVVEFRPMHVKIGRSKNPLARLRTLTTQSGTKALRTWVSEPCYNYCALELALHDHFKSSRLIGEYFKAAFDDAVFVAESLPYQLQTKEQDNALDEKQEEMSSKLIDHMTTWFRSPGIDEEVHEERHGSHLNGRMVGLCELAKCFCVTKEELLVTIAMSYDDFIAFGPFIESGNSFLLNDKHVSFLVILLPTTDQILPFKVTAAKLLAISEVRE